MNVQRNPPRKLAATLALLVASGVGLSACGNTRGVDPMINLESMPPVSAEEDHVGLVEAFVNSATASRKSSTDAALALAAFQSGGSLIEVRCKLFFTALGRAQQNLDFGAQELTLSGGLAAAILGLVEAGTKSIAITSSAFAFSAATLESFRQSYLFGPDVSTVHELVRGAMDAYSKTVADQGVPNYSASMALLSGYERLCEVHEIRRLVNEAVEIAKPKPKAPVDDTASAETTGQSSSPPGALTTPNTLSAPAAQTRPASRNYSVGITVR